MDVKQIGNFKAKFRTIFNKEESEDLILVFSISENLKELLEKCVLNEKTAGFYYDGMTQVEFMRFKVFRAFYSILNPSIRDVLFSLDLLKKKEFKFVVKSVSQIDELRSNLRTDLKILIKSVLKYSEIDETISFNLKK